MTSKRRGVAGLVSGLAVGLGLWATAGTASAQILGGRFAPVAGCDTGTCAAGGCATGDCTSCDTKCGVGGKTGLLGPKPGWKGPYGPGGRKIYPLFEKRYIAQFPCPTVAPGTCFGYRKTQWTRWEDACPNWDHGHPTPISYPAPPGTPVNGTPTVPPNGTAPMSPLPSAPMPLPTKPPEKPPEKPGVEKGMGLPTIPTIPQVPTKAPAPTPVRSGKY